MHIRKLLHKAFHPASAFIDKRLHRTLLEAVLTLSDCRHLSIAGLGRCLSSSTAVKYAIKRMDRLFGNAHLHRRRSIYYQRMVGLLVAAQPRPVILIDWSGLTRCGAYHFLRASVPVGGRALVLWESTYREKEYMSQQAHRVFIRELKALLPAGCCPIMVTDAGFRCPWFKLVHKQGWHYIGRVRNRAYCRENGQQDWVPAKDLYPRATRTARYLFAGLLARDNPIACHFYVFLDKRKRRVRRNLRGKRIQSSVSLKHEKREREPWLIVSSLPTENHTPAQIIALYKTRMQIEEALRDLKNTRNGFSLRHCRSFAVQRLNIALLIAAIALLLLWIIGVMAKQRQQHYHYQANSVRHRTVLSVFTIGWQSLKRKRQFYITDFCSALSAVQMTAKNAW